MANVLTNDWDETKPAGTRDANLGDDDIRELKGQIREIFEVDHVIESSGNGENWGKHNKSTYIEQSDIGTGSSGECIAGAQTDTGGTDKPEFTYTDEDDNDVVFTRGGKIAIENGDLPNNTNLKALKSDNSQGDLIKMNTDDVPEIPDGAVMASDAAPGSDPAIANKKYVDDQITANLKAFGDWASKNMDTTYQAETDGFVVGYQSGGNYVAGYTDSNASPTTKRFENGSDSMVGGESQWGIFMPVKSGDYWKIDSGRVGGTLFWIPLS